MALSAKEVAKEFGTDARTFRKFMRNILEKEDQPGQGNRYAIDEKDLKKLKKRFDEWQAPKTKSEEPATNGAKPKKTKTKKEVEVVDITTEASEDLEVEDEPSDEELMELESAMDILDEDAFELD